jgi:hypothetical protein
MQRADVLQELLSLFAAPSYLEIGVDQGVTFAAVRAMRKVAVDVAFAFDWRAAAAAGGASSYVEATSDRYFAELRGRETFDVVFIDGLHTYEQTLRDLLNACACLREGGIIVVDDVMPSTYAASLPDLDLSRRFWLATANPDESWMGDVFRLVFFIETFMPAFSYATVAENHGQLVLWQQPRIDAPHRTVEATARMQYVDAVMNADVFHIEPLAAIKAKVAAWKCALA